MIISVGSFEEAKNYPVMFNTSELLMDNTRDVFYVKSVDGMGKYVINTYSFKQIENEKPLTAENFVTREKEKGRSAFLSSLFKKEESLPGYSIGSLVELGLLTFVHGYPEVTV